MAKWLSVAGLFAVISGSLIWLYFKQNSKKRSLKRFKNSVAAGSPVESNEFPGESEDSISLEVARAFMIMLKNEFNSDDFKHRVVITIAKKAAFTQNHAILREGGCLIALSAYVQCLEFRCKGEKDLSMADLIESALNAVNNLANSEENQRDLQDCIGSLLVFASSDRFVPLRVRVAALRCLVNFTCTDSCAESFIQSDIQMLFDLTEEQMPHELRIMSLKLLANLSWQKNMSVKLLTSTVSHSFFDYLCSSDDIVLRWLTILRNLTMKMDMNQLLVEKCSSGRLTLAEIFSDVSHRKLLEAKLSELRTHSDSDIKQLAVQLSMNLTQITA